MSEVDPRKRIEFKEMVRADMNQGLGAQARMLAS